MRQMRGIMVGVAAAVLSAGTPAGAQCRGDFNGDLRVTIDELISSVENALDGCAMAGDRFVDNGDGTITDRQTRLLWEKKTAVDRAVQPGNLHDGDATYAWAGTCVPSEIEVACQPTAAALAVCPAGAPGCAICGDEQACEIDDGATTIFDWVAQLNAAAFAGYSDWRVPTLGELGTLVDRGTALPAVDAAFRSAGCATACADIVAADCSCTTSFFYWTATPAAPIDMRVRAWNIRFDIGALDAGPVGLLVHGRAVRAAP
ncbi:MAG: DUF1566 domain-containing protein [Candidatus Binatia bacterium]